MTLLKRFLARSAFLVLLVTGFSAVPSLLPDVWSSDFHANNSHMITAQDTFQTVWSAFEVERVYADTTGASAPSKDASSATTDGMMLVLSLINSFISVISYISFPLVMLAGWLLTPDWTFGDIFGLRPILHSLWVLVSNVVYVIFALMLVVVAFVNIFSSNQHYELKSALPKLFKGILIVPFTWFIVSATLSISNILTASIMQLPLDMIMSTEGDAKTYLEKAFAAKIIPKNITIDLTEGKGGQSGGADAAKTSDMSQAKCAENPSGCISIKELFSSAGGAYGLLNAYAYGIFKIGDIKAIPNQSVASGVTTMVLQIVKSLTFSSLYAVMFMLIVIALVYALFTRAVALWMYAIFSPLFALNIGLEGIMPKNFDKLTKKASLTEFIWLAMVPVYVSAALAFGLIFTSLVMGGMSSLQGKSDYVEFDSSATEQKMVFAKQITLTTKGDFRASWEDPKIQQVGAGIIGTVIMGFVSILVIWLGVMAALESSSITASAVAPIAQFGKSIGQLAMKAPQYIPIPIPWSGGKSMSMSGLQRMGEWINQTVSSAASNTGSKYGSSIWQAVARWMGIPIEAELANANQKLQGIISRNTNSSSLADTKIKDMQEAFNIKGISLTEIAGNADLKKQYGTLIKNLYGEEISKKWEAAGDSLALAKVLHEIETKDNRTFWDGTKASTADEIEAHIKQNMLKVTVKDDKAKLDLKGSKLDGKDISVSKSDSVDEIAQKLVGIWVTKERAAELAKEIHAELASK